MASTKKVSFSPNTAETKPSKATSSDATSLVENDFLDRPTILRVKRKRSELPLDIIGTLKTGKTETRIRKCDVLVQRIRFLNSIDV